MAAAARANAEYKERYEVCDSIEEDDIEEYYADCWKYGTFKTIGIPQNDYKRWCGCHRCAPNGNEFSLYSFAMNPGQYECDLPPAKLKPMKIPAFIYHRFVVAENGHGTWFQPELFLPNEKIIIELPHIELYDNTSRFFRTRPCEKLVYEQFSNSTQYGIVKSIRAKTLKSEFVDKVIQHNQKPLPLAELKKVATMHGFAICDTDYPKTQIPGEWRDHVRQSKQT